MLHNTQIFDTGATFPDHPVNPFNLHNIDKIVEELASVIGYDADTDEVTTEQFNTDQLVEDLIVELLFTQQPQLVARIVERATCEAADEVQGALNARKAERDTANGPWPEKEAPERDEEFEHFLRYNRYSCKSAFYAGSEYAFFPSGSIFVRRECTQGFVDSPIVLRNGDIRGKLPVKPWIQAASDEGEI